MDPYSIGYREALEKLGAPAGLLSRVGSRVAQGARTVGRALFGRPGEAYSQARAGKLFAKGGLGRYGMNMPGMLGKTMLWGLPAYSIGQSALSDDPNKASNIAGLAAGTVAGNAAFGPTGLIGAMAIGGVADWAARKGADKLRGVRPQGTQTQAYGGPYTQSTQKQPVMSSGGYQQPYTSGQTHAYGARQQQPRYNT